MGSKPHAHPSAVLLGGRWHAITEQGDIIGWKSRPIEPAVARGLQACVHCGTQCNSYCKSCRMPVCASPCFDTHAGDHTGWRGRQWGWTKVER